MPALCYKGFDRGWRGSGRASREATGPWPGASRPASGPSRFFAISYWKGKAVFRAGAQLRHHTSGSGPASQQENLRQARGLIHRLFLFLIPCHTIMGSDVFRNHFGIRFAGGSAEKLFHLLNLGLPLQLVELGLSDDVVSGMADRAIIDHGTNTRTGLEFRHRIVIRQIDRLFLPAQNWQGDNHQTSHQIEETSSHVGRPFEVSRVIYATSYSTCSTT